MTKSSQKNAPHAGIDLNTACISIGIVTDPATAPGWVRECGGVEGGNLICAYYVVSAFCSITSTKLFLFSLHLKEETMKCRESSSHDVLEHMHMPISCIIYTSSEYEPQREIHLTRPRGFPTW